MINLKPQVVIIVLTSNDPTWNIYLSSLEFEASFIKCGAKGTLPATHNKLYKLPFTCRKFNGKKQIQIFN